MVPGGPAQDLVLLLEEADPVLVLTQLFGVGLGQTGPHPCLDVVLLEPGMQSGFGDPEVLGNLAERCFPFTGHGDNVSVELSGKGFSYRFRRCSRSHPDQAVLGSPGQ
jgi:hypothetical protein